MQSHEVKTLMSDAARSQPLTKPLERTHFDLAAHEEALSDFQSLLKTSLHTRDLETWVTDSLVVTDSVDRPKWG